MNDVPDRIVVKEFLGNGELVNYLPKSVVYSISHPDPGVIPPPRGVPSWSRHKFSPTSQWSRGVEWGRQYLASGVEERGQEEMDKLAKLVQRPEVDKDMLTFMLETSSEVDLRPPAMLRASDLGKLANSKLLAASRKSISERERERMFWGGVKAVAKESLDWWYFGPGRNVWKRIVEMRRQEAFDMLGEE